MHSCVCVCVCVCVCLLGRSVIMNSATRANARETRSKVISTQLFSSFQAYFQHMQQLKMMTNIQAHENISGFWRLWKHLPSPVLHSVTILCCGIILKMAVHTHSLGVVVIWSQSCGWKSLNKMAVLFNNVSFEDEDYTVCVYVSDFQRLKPNI